MDEQQSTRTLPKNLKYCLELETCTVKRLRVELVKNVIFYMTVYINNIVTMKLLNIKVIAFII